MTTAPASHHVMPESLHSHSHSSPTARGSRQTTSSTPKSKQYGLHDDARMNLYPVNSASVSKYEYARLMCARVTDLARNAPPAISNNFPSEPGSLLTLAEKEFDLGLLPYSLARRLPSGGESIHQSERLHRLPSCTYPTGAEHMVKISGLNKVSP